MEGADLAVREIHELKEDILKAKESAKTAVLSHYYTDPDIQDISDCVGDTLELALFAHRTDLRRIVVCGAHFNAETCALLCPDKEIILAHPQARCPMSGQIYAGRIRMYREDHPDALVVTALNASAQLKAESDLCLTQDNATTLLHILGAKEILFAADRNFGEYLSENLPGISFTLLNCTCPMLSSATAQDVELARQKWSGALIAANISCRREVRREADMVGSTTDIIRYCENSDSPVIIADDNDVRKALCRRFPEREFHQLAPSKFFCSSMRINNLEILELSILGRNGVRTALDSGTRIKALKPLERMIELSGISL